MFARFGCLSAKVVAYIYWFTSFLFAILGVSLSILIRLEWSFPLFVSSGSLYYSTVTLHGFVMVFMVLVPATQGFMNWLLPGLLGCYDFLWPRINLGSALGLGYSGFVMMFIWIFSSGWFSGWTAYPPLSVTDGCLIYYEIGCLHAIGIFSLLATCNVLASFYCSCSLGCTVEISLFVWSSVVSSMLFVMSSPCLVLALLMLVLDVMCSTMFYDCISGGDPVLYQTLFWFFGHPEVYVVILPVFGCVSLYLESGGLIHGREGVVSSTISIGVLGFGVYAHHMYTLDLEVEVKMMFTAGTMAISLPTGVKVYCWSTSLFMRGSRLLVSDVCVATFVVTFVMGGCTGIVLSACAVDEVLHDTTYVVAHFHQVMGVSAIVGLSCGLGFVRPVHSVMCCCVIMFALGSSMVFIPLYLTGVSGVPRRCAVVSPDSSSLLSITSVGMVLSIASSIAGLCIL